MPDIADPLVRGLLAGMQFTQAFRNARRQQEELAMRKEALAEARQQRQRQNELQDLQQRIQMTNAGIRPVNEEDEFRASLAGVPRFRADETGAMQEVGTGVSGTDVGERMLNYRGQRLVMPTEAEKQSRAAEARRAITLADMGAKEEGRAKYAQSFELEPGVATTVLPSEIPANIARRAQIEQSRAATEASRALTEYRRRPPTPKQYPVHWTEDKFGNVTGLERTPEGLNVLSGPETQGIGKPQQPPSGAGATAKRRLELAEEEATFRKAEAARKEQKAEHAKAATQLATLDKEADPYHADRVKLGEEAELGVYDETTIRPAMANFKATTARIQGIEYRKAAIFKGAKPSDKFAESVKDGETRTAPDGTTWRKEGKDDNAILYFVEGPRKKQLTPSTVTTEIPEAEMPYTGPTGKVKMRAPDGTVTEVPPELVGHYESKGAKRI
ncbi:MAG: hypothetical protein V1790_17535 [Planctomycetota bacterium]